MKGYAKGLSWVWFLFTESKWNIVIFIVDLSAPLLWQPVNPSLSSAVAARRVSFSTCHFDSLPGALVLIPSALALPWVIKGSPANHTRWNVRGRLPANGSRRAFRMNPGWRDSFFCFHRVILSGSVLLSSFIVLHSPGISVTLEFTDATVYTPYLLQQPSMRCPWVGDNIPSFHATEALPLLWTSWLIINHLRWTHMPTHMCDGWAPPLDFYPSSSSAPNTHWLNHQLGLLHRPLWPCVRGKWAAREQGGGGRDVGLNLHSNIWFRSGRWWNVCRRRERAAYFLIWAHQNIQTASRWSFCGDPCVNNRIKKGSFLTVPESCTRVWGCILRYKPCNPLITNIA